MEYSDSVKTSEKIARLVEKEGGRTYYVGGFVRDRLRNLSGKDIDIEVHGIAPYKLEEILDCIGQRIETGKSFGVYKLCKTELDIAMPRKESATGSGHRDFKVEVDPFIGTMKAAMRRDFTINALMQDVLTGEIIDHFGGIEDLKNGVLRHVSKDSFPEDPLRVLRGAQFAARFNFTIAHETVSLCKAIDIAPLSKERVFDEMGKALLKAEKPSLFFENLRLMGQLFIWFPEVEQLIGVPQHTIHHKEGDVWNHTMMVLDEAAKKRSEAENPLYFMISALVHDFGKIVSTEFVKGNYHAYNHEIAGAEIADKFLKRITNENALVSYALNMTKLHMKPHIIAADRSSVKAGNKMFDSAKSPNDLILLSLCDGLGKIPPKDNDEAEAFLRERLKVFYEYMSRPFVDGNDLIEAGIKPGKDFSILLKLAHSLRLSGVSKKDALSQVLSSRGKHL